MLIRSDTGGSGDGVSDDLTMTMVTDDYYDDDDRANDRNAIAAEPWDLEWGGWQGKEGK
jgi:hypothetical protein